MLSRNTFQTIVQHTPLVSIDLIIKNAQGQVLLGRRNNRPAQGIGLCLVVVFAKMRR